MYNEEIHKRQKLSYAIKIKEEGMSSSQESRFLPHHNADARVVFNCPSIANHTAFGSV